MTTSPKQVQRLLPAILLVIASINCVQKPGFDTYRRKVLEELGSEARPIRREDTQKGAARYLQNIEFMAKVRNGFIIVVSDFHDRVFRPSVVHRLDQLSYDQAWYLYKIRTKQLSSVNDGDYWLLLAADDSGYSLFISEPIQ